MLKNIITLLLILSPSLSFAQYSNSDFINYLQKADKILLTSHLDNIFIQQENKKIIALEKKRNTTKSLKKALSINKKIEREIQLSTLLINGVPNKRIIIQRVLLNTIHKQELIQIFSTQNKNFSIGHSCFSPHHTIFIYFQKKWSYITICFGCKTYLASTDLPINKESFLTTEEDWEILEIFFRKLNLNYALRKNE